MNWLKPRTSLFYPHSKRNTHTESTKLLSGFNYVRSSQYISTLLYARYNYTSLRRCSLPSSWCWARFSRIDSEPRACSVGVAPVPRPVESVRVAVVEVGWDGGIESNTAFTIIGMSSLVSKFSGRSRISCSGAETSVVTRLALCVFFPALLGGASVDWALDFRLRRPDILRWQAKRTAGWFKLCKLFNTFARDTATA